MGFETPKNTNDIRADKAMAYVRDGSCLTVPEAVRKVLINEHITFEPDVARITQEVASLLAKRGTQANADALYNEFSAENKALPSTDQDLYTFNDEGDLVPKDSL